MAVGWLRCACGWRSTLCACVQCQGLWAWWTVVWGGAIGAVRSSSLQRHRVVVAIGGSQRACGWRSTSHACAQRQGLWARWTVVWGVALGAVRSPMRSSWCSVVAFGRSLPGRSTRSVSHASVQRKGFPWTRGVSRGGTCPMNVVGGRRTFTPLHWCWTVGRRLGCVAVVCLSTTLGPWGLLATWPGVPWVSSSAMGVVAHRHRDSRCRGVHRLRRLRHALVRDALGVAVPTRR